MFSCRAAAFRALVGLLALFSCAYTWALPENVVRIHYHRFNNDYDGWGLHVWGDNLQLDRKVTWSRPLPSSGVDGFGIYFDVPIAPVTQNVGFIVHKGAEKNVPEDMSISVADAREVWHLEGDPKLYYSRAAAAAALAPAAPRPTAARSAVEKENAKREAALKADMQALARQAELDSKKADEELKKQQEEALLKEKEELARMAAERGRVIAELKAQRDANLARSEKDRFLQQQQKMQEEMARRAAMYENRQERSDRSNRMSPGAQFGLAVGGGFAGLVLIAAAVIWWQRRKPAPPVVEI